MICVNITIHTMSFILRLWFSRVMFTLNSTQKLLSTLNIITSILQVKEIKIANINNLLLIFILIHDIIL